MVITGFQPIIRMVKGLRWEFRVEKQGKEKGETDVQSVFIYFGRKTSLEVWVNG